MDMIENILWVQISKSSFYHGGNMRPADVILVRTHLRYTKISNLSNHSPCNEDILAFDVPVIYCRTTTGVQVFEP
jgi:hypothetical protein